MTKQEELARCDAELKRMREAIIAGDAETLGLLMGYGDWHIERRAIEQESE
jgi:hypothetical protein